LACPCIDSAVVAFICARAIGKDRVLSLFSHLKEDSSPRQPSTGPNSGRAVLDVNYIKKTQPGSQSLALFTSAAMSSSVSQFFFFSPPPEYRKGCKSKIVLPGLSATSNQYQIFSVVRSFPPEKPKQYASRKAYLSLWAATNSSSGAQVDRILLRATCFTMRWRALPLISRI